MYGTNRVLPWIFLSNTCLVWYFFRLIKFTKSINGIRKYIVCPFSFYHLVLLIFTLGWINRPFSHRAIPHKQWFVLYVFLYSYKLYHRRQNRIYYFLVTGYFDKIAVCIKHRLRLFCNVLDHFNFNLSYIFETYQLLLYQTHKYDSYGFDKKRVEILS